MVTESSSSLESVLVRTGRKCLRAGARRLANWASIGTEYHLPSLPWRLGRLLIASSKDHAFLDRGWIPPLMRLTPRRLRAPLALRLLSLSPHYWVYQWTNRYPARCTRRQILAAEYERNAASRRQICDRLLRPLLRPEMTVLDFGCGPGFLAKAVSEHVSRVIATDVSRGVIACARQINAADNLRYVVNGLSSLQNVDASSIDFVYSFAVFQHLTKEQSMAFFREFVRVLKPGATGLCHIILKEPHELRLFDPARATG